MDLSLTSKTAVVTGAGRGIGLATVRALTAAGVHVVGAARTLTPEPADTSVSTGAGHPDPTAEQAAKILKGLTGITPVKPEAKPDTASAGAFADRNIPNTHAWTAATRRPPAGFVHENGFWLTFRGSPR
ncbi:SDR family NAD(P)-dependent oxidoreductase [Streptomyces sp. NPDC059076]|uniref:SDR family NAD(P)-dependent oxidoreductase n=1 Tax=unclassified Streptomyces TaxID=2593676 RepID=UPI0036979B55